MIWLYLMWDHGNVVRVKGWRQSCSVPYMIWPLYVFVTNDGFMIKVSYRPMPEHLIDMIIYIRVLVSYDLYYSMIVK